MDAAAEGVQDRLVKDDIALDIRSRPSIGSFIADERRVRQILFNLLANAVGFSPPGGDRHAVGRAAAGRGGVLGHRPRPGHSARRCRTGCSTGSRPIRRARSTAAPGSGLSLVRSFVELHGGTVTINSVVGQGTTVICVFPLEQHAEPERRVA